jgi:pyruvate ferredoxin oxidoreductase alpha subunit
VPPADRRTRALEGSQALAETVALCRPQVIAAYPITPQTHIVEGLARIVADGRLDAEVVSVESEHSAASVVLGAAAAGSRSYTASSSQGILLMSEVVYNIAGMRLPVVMTCANRALGAPISIWNDQQDSMAVRDAGWVQLFCADNQQAVDTTVQAFRIAERLELPVMVCVDGFVLTHTLEPLVLPSQEEVDAFLPPYRFGRTLDPQHPVTHGTLATPEFYTETRHALHRALERAADEIERAAEDWAALTGRHTGGLLQVEGDPEAEVGVLTTGSILGTLAEAAEALAPGRRVRLVHLRSFRPFPHEALRAACRGLRELVVLERCLSPGAGGIVGAEVRAALLGTERPPRVHDFAVGLGGRDVPLDTLERVLDAAEAPRAEPFAIFDVDPEKLPAEDR